MKDHHIPIATGRPVSGGGYRGKVILSVEDIETTGHEDTTYDGYILALNNVTPRDTLKILSVDAILAAGKGTGAHAVGIARKHNKTAIVALPIEFKDNSIEINGIEIESGEILSIDGQTGKVYLGSIDLVSDKSLLETQIGSETTVVDQAA